MAKTETLLGQCLARGLAEWGEGASAWQLLKITPRASRLAGFVVLWAMLLQEGDVDRISIEDYAAAGFDSRATAYRRLADFRELFPDEPDPNRIALLVLEAARRRGEKVSYDLAVAV